MFKMCTNCKKMLDAEKSFYFRSDYPGIRRSQCRDCMCYKQKLRDCVRYGGVK
jgi:hypothetical protein